LETGLLAGDRGGGGARLDRGSSPSPLD
jgi:hypothetical protein